MGTGQKYMKILTIGTLTVYCAQIVQVLSIKYPLPLQLDSVIIRLNSVKITKS